ncbi:MAG: amidohydrolase family protein [Candidatus Jordarchaeum sp.]|uniref:amidohydrolase family protein n=1 Tax=Candidatus Jordarchaeum sp. TaxID=2823881 RepID=UPI00404BA2C0
MIIIDGREIEVIDIHVHPPDILMDPVPPGYKAVEEELLGRMDEAGVDKVALLAFDVDKNDVARFQDLFYRPVRYVTSLGGGSFGSILIEIMAWFDRIVRSEEDIYKYVVKDPNRIIGFGSINPKRPEEEIKEKLRKIKEFGFKGIKLIPTFQFCNPSDECVYPVYEYAQKNKLVILTHTGCDPGLWEYPDFCEDAKPIHLTKIAEDFPRLNIVGAHLGSYSAENPGIWFEEMMQVVKTYDNVFTDASAVDPELVRRAVKTVGADKILYGSDYPVVLTYVDRKIGMKEHLSNILSLDINVDEKEKILSQNAKKILKI